MKSICFVNYNMAVRGGVEQVTASLANALCEKYTTHIFSACLTGNPVYPLDQRIHLASAFSEPYRLRNMRRDLQPLLLRYFEENQIDVAFLQGHYPGFLASTLKHKTRTKLIFCDHGALMNQWHSKDTVLVRYLAARAADKVITLTEQSRQDYIRKFHLKKIKVQYIYNWVDSDLPHAAQYDLTSKRFLSAGRFSSEKGFDVLVKASKAVFDRHPDWHLDLFGDGEMMDIVKSLIADLHLEENITLMGMRNDLAQRYGDYAFYVLPSYREGLPLVLLEAKMNHLPIISFNVMTGPKEIVCDGIDGLLIPPGDTDALADAMCRLIEDDTLRSAMAAHSQDGLDRFSKEKILEQWCALIETEAS